MSPNPNLFRGPVAVVEDAADFSPDPNSAYIYAHSHEPRSRVFQSEQSTSVPLEIIAFSSSDFSVAGLDAPIALRSIAAVDRLIADLEPPVYLDITGLPHHVWAPILRALINSGIEVRVTYVEPADYVLSAAPTEGAIFDLSQEIKGIAPLPGFARLTDPEPDRPVWFVASLGFEGTRFAFMLEQLQPPVDRVVPVIGVPGFRPEYPFYAFQGNRAPLLSTEAWRRVEYCTANSPFGIYQLLSRLARGGDNYLFVAMVGTKPHSLGAVLYAISHPEHTELIYDYPVRSPKRSVGAARQLIYSVSEFLSGVSR